MANVAITDEADEALEAHIDKSEAPPSKKAITSAAILRYVEAES